MAINEHPKGYLVMDTNCFSHYGEGGKVAGFDYDKIRTFVEREGYWVVITPYTLYECVQDLSEPKHIIEERDKWINIRDFWVLNVNKLIGDKYNFEYGMDFLFEFGFDSNNPEAFIKKRDEWKDKVYASLAPRIILLTQIVAINYVKVTELEGDGTFGLEAQLKMKCIDEIYASYSPFKKHLSEFLQNPSKFSKDLADTKDVDAKDYLVLFVEKLVLLMLKNAQDFITQLRYGVEEVVLTFNDPMFTDRDIKRRYPRDVMAERYLLAKRMNKKEFAIGPMMERLLKGREPIFKQLYKRVVNEWFMKGNKGNELANTIIDFVNMGVLEVASTLPCVYITEEKGFVSLIKGMKDERTKVTREFYAEFYEGWDKVIAEKL